MAKYYDAAGVVRHGRVIRTAGDQVPDLGGKETVVAVADAGLCAYRQR